MNRRNLFAMLAGAAMAPFLPKPEPVKVAYDITYGRSPISVALEDMRALEESAALDRIAYDSAGGAYSPYKTWMKPISGPV